MNFLKYMRLCQNKKSLILTQEMLQMYKILFAVCAYCILQALSDQLSDSSMAWVLSFMVQDFALIYE